MITKGAAWSAPFLIDSFDRTRRINKGNTMKNTYKLKAAAAFLCAFTMCVTAAGQQSGSIKQAYASEAQQNAQDIDDTKKKITELEKKQKTLDDKISSTEQDISDEKENQSAIEEQIETVSETISALNESIISLDKEIGKKQKEISEQQGKIDTKRSEIESGIESFKGRLRAMYIAGSESYTEVLLGSKDFYDMLMKIELVKRVADHDKNELDSLVKLKDEYEAELTALEQKQQELKEKNDELTAQKEKSEKQKKKLAGLYEKSKKLISELEKSEKAYKKNLKELEKDQQQFEDELQALYQKEKERKQKEAEAAAAAEKARLEQERLERERLEREQAQQQAENDNSNDTTDDETDENEVAPDDDDNSDDSSYTPPASDTGFIWPVPGKYGISSGMGWRWGSFDKGIDIWAAGIRGSNVVAAASGTVIQYCNDCTHDYAKDGSCGCGGGYGNYVVIDHGNGYWTLYGHMQYTTVSLGDTVSQGQKIGVVGTTGWSTGDHCHFEVRQNGEPVDPTQYVSY